MIGVSPDTAYPKFARYVTAGLCRTEGTEQDHTRLAGCRIGMDSLCDLTVVAIDVLDHFAEEFAVGQDFAGLGHISVVVKFKVGNSG